MKSFRNVFLVSALAAASLLGWGCKGGKEYRSREQVPAEQQQQQGTGGAGTSDTDMGRGSGASGTQGQGQAGEKGTEQPGKSDSRNR